MGGQRAAPGQGDPEDAACKENDRDRGTPRGESTTLGVLRRPRPRRCLKVQWERGGAGRSGGTRPIKAVRTLGFSSLSSKRRFVVATVSRRRISVFDMKPQSTFFTVFCKLFCPSFTLEWFFPASVLFG